MTYRGDRLYDNKGDPSVSTQSAIDALVPWSLISRFHGFSLSYGVLAWRPDVVVAYLLVCVLE